MCLSGHQFSTPIQLPPAFPVPVPTVGNLTAQTSYEIAAWARTDLGDSPLAFEHIVTKGVRPPAPSLKAKALNQTAVECSWTGPRDVVSAPGCGPPDPRSRAALGSLLYCCFILSHPKLGYPPGSSGLPVEAPDIPGQHPFLPLAWPWRGSALTVCWCVERVWEEVAAPVRGTPVGSGIGMVTNFHPLPP